MAHVTLLKEIAHAIRNSSVKTVQCTNVHLRATTAQVNGLNAMDRVDVIASTVFANVSTRGSMMQLKIRHVSNAAVLNIQNTTV